MKEYIKAIFSIPLLLLLIIIFNIDRYCTLPKWLYIYYIKKDKRYNFWNYTHWWRD